ncbi:MAG: LLM class F420-dependent oxidoreductase [Acidimicrobiia bacterium]|nr:LLM class F420-dependent oxidoreductase [Acidimicrobiia bacterium]
MKLSTSLNYAGGFKQGTDQVVEMEKAGLDMVWVAEAYSFDAVSSMGYLAAKTSTVEIAAGILPIYTRTPTLIAMTAAGIDALSDGRCILGLGASGPQVIEGFHGVVYDRPLGRTREIIDVCRQVWRREKVEHSGVSYQIPVSAGKGSGLGKPLKLINHPVRSEIPIYVASLGPKNVEMTAEKADGWLPLFYLPERAQDVWGADLAAGAAKRDTDRAPMDVVAGGLLAVGEGAEAVREYSRPVVALYVGGMGAKGKNFYNDLICRYGFEAEAEAIQDLYLQGKKDEAAQMVPDALLEATSLCGSEGYVKERLAAYQESGVTVLNITPIGKDPVKLIEQVKGWIQDL